MPELLRHAKVVAPLSTSLSPYYHTNSKLALFSLNGAPNSTSGYEHDTNKYKAELKTTVNVYHVRLAQPNPAAPEHSLTNIPWLFYRSEPYDPYVPRGGSSGNPAGGAPGNSKTAAIQAQIDDTVGIMRENITKVAERGERLDSLQDKTGKHCFSLNCAQRTSG